MVTSPISTRNDIVSAIAQASGQDQAVIGQIFEHVAIQDLVERDPAYLGGAAGHLVELATNRTEPTALEVFTPTQETHGWHCSRTVVQVCTPDSPFLVDSITEAISQLGYRVHLFIHPIMPSGGNSRATDESWMHIEMTRLGDDQAHAKVRERLSSVLADVAKAVDDWQAMREQTLRLVEGFTSNPPPTVEPSDITLAGEFLTWLTHGHFTFLGYREYSLEEEADGELVLAPVSGTALGILSHEPNRVSRLRPEAQQNARSPRLLTITKANSRATVHRSAYLDYIGIRTFDDAGHVTGEHRLLGLFTSSAYAESVTQVPIVSNKVDEITRILGYAPTSHSGKDLLQVLETFPRDELFQDSAHNLAQVAREVLYLAERRRSKMFVRADEFGRFVSVLVFMPRDRFSTHVRLKIEDLLRKAYGDPTIDFTTSITESPLAQVHLVLRMPP
ncbi:MAG TPA: NAD-glutamate dehydrogenase, partial [Beutenbergiaceae bacterium]|nr:NAD-glutamate dehydrogenase [Beutenbergiaceae bacterium]